MNKKMFVIIILGIFLLGSFNAVGNTISKDYNIEVFTTENTDNDPVIVKSGFTETSGYDQTIDIGNMNIFDGKAEIDLQVQNPYQIVAYDIDELYKFTIDYEFKEAELNILPERWRFDLYKDISDVDLRNDDKKIFGDTPGPTDKGSGQLWIELRCRELTINPIKIGIRARHYEYTVRGTRIGWFVTSEKWIELELDLTLYKPKIKCEGSLEWANVESDSKIFGNFTIENIGEAGSTLDWKAKGEFYQSTGEPTITMQPNTGENLKPEDGKIDVQVIIETTGVPTGFNAILKGKITCSNTNNIWNSVSIPFTINMKKSRAKNLLLENSPLQASILNLITRLLKN